MAANGPASINDVLTTPKLRTELVALIALASDSMRRDLLAIFEPVKITSNVVATDPLLDLSEQESKINEQRAQNLQRQASDLNSTKTQGLRRAALTWFDKWQIDVLRRLGEVLSVKSDAVRKARADAKVQAEAAAKSRRDARYHQWADGVDTEPQQPDIDDGFNNILPEGFKSDVLGLPKEKRIIVMDSVLLLLLSLEHYTAHSRVLMARLTQLFQLPMSILAEHESKLAEGLLDSAAAQLSSDASTQRQASNQATARRWKIGLATVAGAALIGVTGGLAAPILAGSIGSIMGGLGLGAVASLLGPLATNVVLVGGLFGAYGGRMTGNIMEKYAGDVKDFKFLPMSTGESGHPERVPSPLRNEAMTELQNSNTRKSHKLRVAIGVSGSLADRDGFTQPWKVFAKSRIEPFGLQWETEALTQLLRKTSEVLQSYAIDFAGYQLLSLLLVGLWPFGVLRAASVLDNPFAIAKSRADKAGKVLADALIEKVQGERPVTLVGYSLGSRVIYSCLLQLAEQNAFGLVENVVFMGSPVPSDAVAWRQIRTIVAGRVVNVHSADDFILGFLYRASSAQLGIAGVQQVEGVAGVENYDLTDLIEGHDKYLCLVGAILQRVGFEDLDSSAVSQQIEELEQLKVRSKEQQHQDSRPSEQRIQDSSLAREVDDGKIVLVNSDLTEKQLGTERQPDRLANDLPVADHGGNGSVEEEEDDLAVHTIQLTDNDEAPLSIVDPVPEPDYGPDRETVSFGSGVRGFNVQWDHGSH